MLARIKAPLAKLSNYPRLRILVIILAVVVVFVILMNLLSSSGSGNSTPPSKVQPVSVTNSKMQLKHQTTTSDNAQAQYNQLQGINQQQQTQSAATSGKSVFEDPFGTKSNATAPTTGSSNTTSTTTASSTSSTTSSTSGSGNTNSANPSSSTQGQSGATSPQQFSKQQQQQNSDNEKLQQQLDQLQGQLQQQTDQNNQVSQIENNMRTAMGNLTASWAIPAAATVQGAAPAASGSTGPAAPGPVIIKAGTIFFGVLDTALDSDQPGTPVMATVINGPYKGAKLLGAFQAVNDALVVQFNNMSLPNLTRTIGINAYALDQNTANNAIATSVDHHYLLRYGMLFASAFLQGFGNAYQNYNYTCPPGTANCTLINSNGTPNTTATTKTATYQGLGQVGTTLSQVAAQQFNTPPTIKVDQGTGIGVLFMSDVSLPAN